jgi:hypothetical protein
VPKGWQSGFASVVAVLAMIGLLDELTAVGENGASQA